MRSNLILVTAPRPTDGASSFEEVNGRVALTMRGQADVFGAAADISAMLDGTAPLVWQGSQTLESLVLANSLVQALDAAPATLEEQAGGQPVVMVVDPDYIRDAVTLVLTHEELPPEQYDRFARVFNPAIGYPVALRSDGEPEPSDLWVGSPSDTISA
jgi:hypothetical protein